MALGKKTFEPLLLFLAIVMILCGSALALGFGYAAWQVLYHPEKVSIVTYIIGEIASTQETPALTATVNGQKAVYNLSTSMKAFGLCYLFITGLSLLISAARCMSDIGVHIVKALWPAPAAAPKKRPPAGTNAPPTPHAPEPQDSSRAAI